MLITSFEKSKKKKKNTGALCPYKFHSITQRKKIFV